ncbi:MAG: tRNA (guanosine(37)-N1)-methyltransferase TrmD [Candidatus Coatesbacteria bacterium]|nr:MAG: tRNA (guanosine(37)-N1)-methyltransferase TrmD [Candidatus Coatesbacteria bacterium]
MEIDVVTIFPGFFDASLGFGVLGRAVENGLVKVRAHDLRDYADGEYKGVDDYPFGGGVGMVMKPEPFFRCVEAIETEYGRGHRVYLTPQGRPLTQGRVQELAGLSRLIILCGRYKGVDERVRLGLVDEEISVGDFVLSGGEAAALALIDSIARLQQGALGDEDSAATDSFTTGLLDHPHYTRPQEFLGMRVPDVLLSGDHAAIEKWRREQALERTKRLRPDLLFREEENETT